MIVSYHVDAGLIVGTLEEQPLAFESSFQPCCFFNDGHSDLDEMEPPCNFNFHFSDG